MNRYNFYSNLDKYNGLSHSSENLMYEDNYIFNQEKQEEMYNNAKNNNKFNMNFLEATIDANMTDEERVAEYKKFLKNPYEYLENFNIDEWKK